MKAVEGGGQGQCRRSEGTACNHTCLGSDRHAHTRLDGRIAAISGQRRITDAGDVYPGSKRRGSVCLRSIIFGNSLGQE